jgi:hypothetical protein
VVHDESGGSGGAAASDRLTNSVIRPLEAVLPHNQGDSTAASPHADPLATLRGAPLVDLAQDLTRLRLRSGVPSELLEATAALQDLACGLATEDESAHRLARFREIQAALPASI